MAWSPLVRPHLNPQLRLSLVLAVLWQESTAPAEDPKRLIDRLWLQGFSRGKNSTNDALARFHAGTARSEQGQIYAAQVMKKVIAIERLADAARK
jgi:hypothetical protein